MVICLTCKEEAIHYLNYANLDTPIEWTGYYCGPCFVKKLRGMAGVWDKK